jgi:hypothetical protein
LLLRADNIGGVPTLLADEPAFGRSTEPVSTVLIVGFGLKVTVRTGFLVSPLCVDGDASSGVLSVVAPVEAIATTAGAANVL